MTRLPVVSLLVLCAGALLHPTRAAAVTRAERSPALAATLRDAPRGEGHLVWVYLKDKGARPALAPLSPRALARRALRGEVQGVDAGDLALDPGYLRAVADRVTRLRHSSRWMNAVSVEATAAQVEAVEALPFVARTDVVRRFQRRREPVEPGHTVQAQSQQGPVIPHVHNYGSAIFQVHQINVANVHDIGIDGRGVVVAVFDSGFDNLAHEVFSQTGIAATRDFVNGDESVADGDVGEGSHGTATLSTLGGYRSGQLIGTAFGATYLLAKTENTESETPVEEDNWAAAAEWAEALGADVISSSLGYITYDSPFPSYTFADMNGDTAISTNAADRAAERGIVVVNSAGNEGLNTQHNTLGAPSDGHLVVAVGAVTFQGARASFSSVGPSADGRIKPDVVALMLQANPRATVDQVIGTLRATASRAATPDNQLGYGIVNALAAVQAITALPAASSPD